MVLLRLGGGIPDEICLTGANHIFHLRKYQYTGGHSTVMALKMQRHAEISPDVESTG